MARQKPREVREILTEAFALPEHGSPAETLLWAGIRLAATFGNNPIPGGTGFAFQHQIGPYRVDFVFGVDGQPALVVEVDGHEWHEKTKEQAAKDKARDRYLVEAGYRVIRFTGSEVWANPIKCGESVLRIARGGSPNG